MNSIRHQALRALQAGHPSDKVALVHAIEDVHPLQSDEDIIAIGQTPGLCDKPPLVPPMDVPRRKISTPEGHAALVHALAHIEFNAINLALDILWRFAGQPEDFYRDWLKVAREEAYHFSLLQAHLITLGYAYGDFTAHNGLWDMAERTKGDLLARLALVPRTLEARGLDVTPQIRDRLKHRGDGAGAAILDIILRDEVGHVAIGNRWYKALCDERGLETIATYTQLALQYQAAKQRGPFNLEARRAAGFSEAELAALQLPD
ncbi:ferritin-like domain-containing protein [Iodobacter sp.]|uniref:ferritin-like domain-containing protein n=1 Tax=Iodobacter sp. TaxID=1915058 RepID=UPI00260126DA|nr:ferritin-like domain-containing protein [Iodobacter sp.]